MISKSVIKLAAANFMSATGILDFVWGREPSWRILMYHRVCNPSDLLFPIQAGMYVRPETFRMHCEFLKKNSTVILVDELIQKLIAGEKIPKRTVAITFDDGWKDNLENAFPLLKAAYLPATIFLPTNFINTTKLFWTDEIAKALALTPEKFINFPGINRLSSKSDSGKLEFILNSLFALSPEDRETQVESLTKSLPPNSDREFLTWEEISKLDYFGVKIGSHSHNHRLFGEISTSDRQIEFEQSRNILKSKGLLTSRTFVFPGGSHTAKMGEECLAAGYLGSLKTNSRYIKGSSIYPRVGIHEDISNTEGLLKYRLALG